MKLLKANSNKEINDRSKAKTKETYLEENDRLKKEIELIIRMKTEDIRKGVQEQLAELAGQFHKRMAELDVREKQLIAREKKLNEKEQALNDQELIR
jgi:hypothetical protein